MSLKPWLKLRNGTKSPVSPVGSFSQSSRIAVAWAFSMTPWQSHKETTPQ